MQKNSRLSIIPGFYLWNLVLKCLLIFAGGLILMAAVFYLTNQQDIGPTYGEGFRMLSQLREDIFYKSLIIYVGIVLLMLVGIIVISLFYSHRVAGPVYRLGLFAAEISEGHLENDVFLRQDDVIHPLADEMNNMVAAYRQVVEELNHELAEIGVLRKKISAGDDKQAMDEIRARAERVREIVAVLSV